MVEIVTYQFIIQSTNIEPNVWVLAYPVMMPTEKACTAYKFDIQIITADNVIHENGPFHIE